MDSRKPPRPLEAPIPVGDAIVAGAYVEFAMGRDMTLHFASSGRQGMRVFGSSAHVRGQIELDHDFRIPERGETVQVSLGPSCDRDLPGLVPAFAEGDRDRHRKAAAQALMRRGAEEFVAAHMDRVTRAWFDVAHLSALERMRQVAHYEEGLAAPDLKYKEQAFYEECISADVRAADSLDESVYSRPWLYQFRPGYVVVCEGSVMQREEQPWGDVRGDGWIPRCLFSHFSKARAFAQQAGRSGLVIDRVRIDDGRPMVMDVSGWRTPEWSMEGPVLTGALLPSP